MPKSRMKRKKGEECPERDLAPIILAPTCRDGQHDNWQLTQWLLFLLLCNWHFCVKFLLQQYFESMHSDCIFLLLF